jgi:tyrosyl-tRNA synthetase
MSIIKDLKQRGFYHTCSQENNLEELLSKEKITLYLGFDLTAKSLHVGNLMGIMALRIFQKYGHKIIILLGDGTTKIGDPSGKDETRKILSEEDIQENKKNILDCLSQFLDLDKCKVFQNSEWLDKLNYIEMLRDIGKHFSINSMLTMESVKTRLERDQHLSFLEFNYMILQAYDFWHLFKNENCILQLGGSDQWGNIIQGINLINKKEENPNVFALTWPLLTTSDGKKMGKTAQGAVWLKFDMFSDFEYFQYFRNIKDEDLKKMLLIFTDLDLKEIEAINYDNHNSINEAKDRLAFEATKICRGEKNAEICLKKVKDVFSGNLESLEVFEIKSFNIVDVLIEVCLCKSKSEARKLIEQGGLKINDKKITDIDFKIELNKEYVLQKGKKVFLKLIKKS